MVDPFLAGPENVGRKRMPCGLEAGRTHMPGIMVM